MKPVYIIEKEKIDQLPLIIAKEIIAQYEKGYGFKCVSNDTNEVLSLESIAGSIMLMETGIKQMLGIE